MSNLLEYINSIYITLNQKEKLKTCFRNKTDFTLRIEPKVKAIRLKITATQIQKSKTARAHNKACDIKLSKTQLQQSGGFLPFLLPLAATLAPIAAKAIAGTAIASGTKALIDKIRGKGIKRKKPQKGRGYLMPWQVK